MRKSIALFLITLLLICFFTSCDVFAPRKVQNVHFFANGFSYKHVQNANLEATIADVNLFEAELRYLYQGPHYTFDSLIITDGDEDFPTAKHVVKSYFEGTEDVDYETTTYPVFEHFDEYLSQFDVNDDDLTIYYYSGHGFQADVLDKRGGLAGPTYDGTSSVNDYLALPDLLDKMNALPGYKLIILDSCYSGTAQEFHQTADSTLASSFQALLSQPEYQNDKLWVVTASTLNETSFEDPESGHGLFTRGFLEYLGANTMTNTHGVQASTLTLLDVYTKAERLTKQISAEWVKNGVNLDIHIQHPTSSENLFDLILYKK